MMKDSLLETGVFDEVLIPLSKKLYPEGEPSKLVNQKDDELRHLLELKSMLDGWFGEIEEGLIFFQDQAPPEIQKKLKRLTEGDAILDILDLVSDQIFILSIALKLESEELETLYASACEQQEIDLHLARKLFMTLLFFNFTDPRFWVGLAYTYVKNEQHREAKVIYEMAMNASSTSPMPCLYFAKYLIMLNDPLAEDVINEGLRRTTDEATLKEFQSLSS